MMVVLVVHRYVQLGNSREWMSDSQSFAEQIWIDSSLVVARCRRCCRCRGVCVIVIATGRALA